MLTGIANLDGNFFGFNVICLANDCGGRYCCNCPGRTSVPTVYQFFQLYTEESLILLSYVLLITFYFIVKMNEKMKNKDNKQPLSTFEFH